MIIPVPHHTTAILQHTVLYHSTAYHIPYHTLLYHILYHIPHHTIPHHTIPHAIPVSIPYHAIPYHSILYHRVYVLWSIKQTIHMFTISSVTPIKHHYTTYKRKPSDPTVMTTKPAPSKPAPTKTPPSVQLPPSDEHTKSKHQLPNTETKESNSRSNKNPVLSPSRLKDQAEIHKRLQQAVKQQVKIENCKKAIGRHFSGLTDIFFFIFCSSNLLGGNQCKG